MRAPGQAGDVTAAYALDVSPGFFETMRIAMVDGRDFRPGDVPPRMNDQKQPMPGAGIVNEAFARHYFAGQNPVGRSIEWHPFKDFSTSVEIVGLVRDAVYYDIRESIHPTIYVPMSDRQDNTFFVRTAGNPLALADTLRRATSMARSDIRVRTIQPQTNFFRWQVLRERVLSVLSLFFAIIALILAAVGLYGTLNYAVTRQRREIGIRMTLGARYDQVIARVMTAQMTMVCAGVMAGLAGGVLAGRFVEALLYEVKPGDASSVFIPLVTLFSACILAILPPAIRAARIDPAETLRSE